MDRLWPRISTCKPTHRINVFRIWCNHNNNNNNNNIVADEYGTRIDTDLFINADTTDNNNHVRNTMLNGPFPKYNMSITAGLYNNNIIV